jgi:hypothetical protein
MLRFHAFLVALLLTSSAASAQAPTPPPSAPPRVPGVAPQAPPRDATAPKTGTARIRGRVVAADTGQPLRKAQVRATSAELRENRLATTDDNGAYEINELPAGRYQLMATKGSFLQLQYGQARPFEPGKPLEVADGQSIDKVDFNLPRGGILTGRVLDEVGEPTMDVQVSVFRYGYVQGRRQLVPTGRIATTNDIGEYRIFGLPPGQYYLSATVRTGSNFDRAAADRTGYAPTYYPGTPTVSEAQRLTVELGQTRTNIDAVLTPTRLARITGTAVDSDGKPISSGQILLSSQTGGLTDTSVGSGVFRPDGSFTITNLTPGDYGIRVIGVSVPLPGGGVTPDSVSASFTIAGEDINGLQLIGMKPSTVTGRVILPQAAPGTIRPSSIQLTTTAARPTPIPLVGGSGGASVKDDFTFEMKVQPGQWGIRLAPQVQGATLKAVRQNGTDVTDTGIEIRPNEDLRGLEIELTTQVTELSGMVADARGQTVKDYSVVVFARDSARWTFGSRYFGTGRADQDGRFKVRNLPPGDYYAIALDYVEPGAGTDPEFLEKIRDRATPFSMTEGGIQALDLKVVSGA